MNQIGEMTATNNNNNITYVQQKKVFDVGPLTNKY